ncbi:SRSO17 transposase [Pseudochelatococcus contaminans]|uniref:SRSO17 transposase n=1 Tax=Pseudochelatococcus contaminans TaxID=1538103 RepID=A0A7W5Z6Y8_9HYPH|nr:SRSO17 transposase [Pseudochelatococcus contaminans]
MVGDDHAGLASPLEERGKFPRDATPGDRGIRDRRLAFARNVIDDVEHAKPSSTGKLVVDEIQRPSGIGLSLMVVDETGFLKKGEQSVGVARQYSGTAGRIENSQIGVFLAYASRFGQTLIDRRLYLPRTWADDNDRRVKAHVPEDIAFATKIALAHDMISAALDARVPCRWVLADALYGGDYGLRGMLEERRQPYVLAVRSNHHLRFLTREGLVMTDPKAIADELPAQEWAMIAAGEGAKGLRLYDWARLRLPWITDEGFERWLLIRRNRKEPDKRAYYLVFAPQDTSLAELAGAADLRWTIEECFERAKDELGLDHCEARSWHG